jgi:mitogen-activated protein kinase kinase kinase
MPTTFSKEDYLGAVPEDDVSPTGDRKSYMSFDSHDSVSVVVTNVDEDTEEGTLVNTGYSLDRQSMVSTPGTEMDSSFLNQLLAPDDSDEDEDEDDYMDENMDGLRWMKGTLIGAGSFGSVYLALNSLTGELMAVKQVEMPTNAKDDARKQSMIDALSREIALLRDLQHPNIVQYLASSKEDNCFNIFLEYVPGGSVAAMLNNYGPLKEPLVRNFVRQILQGLAYLHGKNIIHRDIKGANVLVDNKGGIKISDFGISKKVEAGLLNSSAAHHRPSLQGSVFWMAPEVVKQTSYTLKADIWSLGCLIVEMLTGSHPYPDCSQLQAIFKIGTGGSAPQIPEKCTSEAKTFLSQTFELDHNKRPTAEELLTSPFMLPLVGMGGA